MVWLSVDRFSSLTVLFTEVMIHQQLLSWNHIMAPQTQTGSTVAELPEGYQPVPEEDRKKAKTFSDFARKSGDTGNYDYAIEMYMQALGMDPDAVDTHQSLRDLGPETQGQRRERLGLCRQDEGQSAEQR